MLMGLYAALQTLLHCWLTFTHPNPVSLTNLQDMTRVSFLFLAPIPMPSIPMLLNKSLLSG